MSYITNALQTDLRPDVPRPATFNGAVPVAAFVLILSLPFMQLFTVDLIFPLKIFEIAIIAWGVFALATLRLHVFDVPILLAGIVLTFYCAIALMINLRILGNFGDFSYLSRWSPEIDGFMKCAYLLLCVLGLNLVAYAAYFQPKRSVDFWLIGACTAASIHLTLFLMSLVGLSIPNLPGMPDNPQMIDFAGMRLYRAATFLEGNYAGPFFALSFLLSCYMRYKWRAYLLLSATLLTFSTTALFGLTAVAIYWMIKGSDIGTKIKVLIVIVPALILSAPVLETFIIDKIYDDSENSSISDRTNTALEALKMFQDNAVIGVGISQYGFNLPGRTRWDFANNSFASEQEKAIPNNVYAETLSELGLIGVLFLTVFLFSVFRIASGFSHPLVKGAAYSIFIFWISSPTITLMYYWAFLGLVCGLARYQQKIRLDSRV